MQTVSNDDMMLFCTRVFLTWDEYVMCICDTPETIIKSVQRSLSEIPHDLQDDVFYIDISQ